MEDYSVQVGVGNCRVTSVYDNQLTCRLPEELPQAADDIFKLNADDPEDTPYPAVIVSWTEI